MKPTVTSADAAFEISFEEFSASYPDIAKDEIDEHGLFIDVDGESFITSNF